MIAQCDALRCEGGELRFVGGAHLLAPGDRGSQRCLAFLDVGVDSFDAGAELGKAGLHGVGGDNGVGRNLAQPRPSDRVSPRRAHRGRALVAGPGRSAFAPQRVAGVVAPEPAVVNDPRRVLVDHDRFPGAGLARPDRDAVAARVVDVRDGQSGVLVVGCPREKDARDAAGESEQTGEGRDVVGREVLAGKVGATVGAETREDHRVFTLDGQIGVVSPSPQVVSHLVVRG